MRRRENVRKMKGEGRVDRGDFERGTGSCVGLDRLDKKLRNRTYYWDATHAMAAATSIVKYAILGYPSFSPQRNGTSPSRGGGGGI